MYTYRGLACEISIKCVREPSTVTRLELARFFLAVVANQQAPHKQQTGINCRPVLAGVLLLGLRSMSTIVDAALMVDHEKYYHADWLAYMVLFAVSSQNKDL